MRNIGDSKRKCANCFWCAPAPLVPEFEAQLAALSDDDRLKVSATLEGECRREVPKPFLIGVPEAGGDGARIVQASPKMQQPGVRIMVTGGFARTIMSKSCAMHEYASEVDDFTDDPADGRATRH